MAQRNRRQFIGDITRLTLAVFVFPWSVRAGAVCGVAHPLTPPDATFHGRCPNCGMVRSMWARTWKTFRMGSDMYETCSFHCLSDMAVKSGQVPRDIQTALFLEPRGMIAAADAWYVIGSSARGTMTMVSKTAFADRPAAVDFVRSCGGKIANYETTSQLARKALEKENAMIDHKRLAKGKIVPPIDMKDECVVCRMYPARYPRHRSQVSYGDAHVDHFCSTHCLFSWLTGFKNGPLHAGRSGMIWVTDFASGRWISGQTAYYVVDSGTMGPMGAEAIAFDRQAEAREFACDNGGQVMPFQKSRNHPFGGPA